MVNPALTPNAAERALIVTYAPPASRAALAALLALDDALAGVIRTTRTPLTGQLRLAWWRERLAALGQGAPVGEPVLMALAEALALGLDPSRLAGLPDSWEALLAETLDRDALTAHAVRGVLLFGEAGRVLGAGEVDRLALAGRGWALADAALHLTDPGAAALARTLAMEALAIPPGARWSRSSRPLGALALAARMDLAGGRAPASPGRVARLAWLRLTGR